MASPLPGVAISTPYGKRGSSWSCNRNSSGQGIHTGCDFACPAGTRILAPIAGQIRHRSYGSAFGNHQFAISPDANQPFGTGEVFFAHTRTRLADGVYVNIGDFVGEVGNEGQSSGPHLHFEYHPNHKNTWSCSVVADPAPVLSHGGGGGTTPPPSSGLTTKYTKSIQSNMLGYDEPPEGYPDGYSLTIKELQWRLNETSLVGGSEIPETGSYWDQTDKEVRLWQEQIAHDPPDPPKKSYLGPNQRALMFPSPPYTIVDAGLPSIASGGGGGGGSGGGGTPPPSGGGGGSGAPVVPSLILPGALWDPIPKNGGGYFTGLRPFKGSAKKITLHTTESSAKPNWQAKQSGIPHLTVDLVLGQSWQHLAFDIAAYTLEGGDHSPNSDAGQNVQIEIIGFANDSPRWPDSQYAELKSILGWLTSNLGVPYEFPLIFGGSEGYGENGAYRQTWSVFSTVSGIVGHSHATYNSHWDPGDLDVDRLAPNGGSPEPPSDGEYVTRKEWFDYRKELAEEAQDVVDVIDPD